MIVQIEDENVHNFFFFFFLLQHDARECEIPMQYFYDHINVVSYYVNYIQVVKFFS